MGPNGIKVVTFNGNGYLDNLNFNSAKPASLTVMLLATATANPGNYSSFMAFNQSQSTSDWNTGMNIDQGLNSTATFGRLNVEGAKAGGNGGFQFADGTLDFGTFYVFEVDDGGGPSQNNSLVTVLVDGVSQVSIQGSSNAINLNNCYIGTRAFTVGYPNTANHDLVGQIAAVLVYDHQLTGSDLTQAQTYLSTFFLRTNLSKATSIQPNSFTYNNFATTKLLRFNGSATNLITSDGPVLELTPPSANQAGSAFTSNHLVLDANDGFGTFFTFRLSKPGNTPAGGITFTIQSASPFSLGSPGGGLGYSGITNSLSVEFDTYNDGTAEGAPGDLNNNHVGVNVNGVLNDSVSVPISDRMNNGGIWYAWIDYSGIRHALEVRLSETPVRPLTASLEAIIDLPAVLVNTNVYVGFTAATAAGWNQQDILSWKFMALPTARFTGHYALTNISPNFTLTNSIAFKQFSYTVNDVSYINTYASVATFTTEPDGSMDFVSEPDTTPIADGSRGGGAAIGVGGGGNEAESSAIISDYADTDPGFVGNGLAFTAFDAIIQGQSFEQSYPGVMETEMEAFINSLANILQATITMPGIDPLGVDPSPFSLPPSVLNSVMQALSGRGQAAEGVTLGAQFGDQIVTYSGAVYRGTVTLREQLISSPPLALVLALPRTTGANFSFDFLTVSNQSYTVWSHADLASPFWRSYTNVLGDGYIRTMTIPITISTNSFYRLSSP